MVELPELAKSLQEERARLKDTKQVIAERRFLVAEQQELKTLRSNLAAISYDPEEHQQALKAVDRLRDADDKLVAVEQAKSDHRALTRRLEEIDDQIQTLKRDQTEINDNLAKMRASLAGVDEIKRSHEEKLEKQRELTKERQSLEQRSGSLRTQLARLIQLEQEKIELEVEATDLAARIDAYRELTTAFGRDGIQAMIIENVLPELEDEANRLLSRMTSKQLEIQFRTTREAVSSGSTIETLDILIGDEAGRRDLTNSSAEAKRFGSTSRSG